MEYKEIENRYTFHSPDKHQIEYMTEIRRICKIVAQYVDSVCPESREKDMAHMSLEQAMFWANAAICRRKGHE